MSLNILSVLPNVNSSGVILQGAVIVTFDQEIDATTYSENSFLLSTPVVAPSISPSGLVGYVSPASGTDYVTGSFSFALNSTGGTIATFKPARPMQPNVKYTVLISTDVATADGTTLASNYSWSFVTGVLNLTVPPIQQPGPSQVGRIRKEDLIVSPRSTLNNDLHQIVISFPDDIDPASFSADDINVDLEAFLQDLNVVVPVITSKSLSVSGHTLTISLTF